MGNMEDVDLETDSWAIAFPHEKKYNLTFQSDMNSWYICRLLAMVRKNHLTAESLNLKKMFDAKENYKNRNIDASQSIESMISRFYNGELELQNEISSIDFRKNEGYKEYNPNVALISLGIMHSVFSMCPDLH